MNPPSQRLVSLDAFRGFIMLMMASSGFGFAQMAATHKDSAFWGFLGSQTSHREWIGCAFWDLIQPSFMFMVGVAMAWSYAKRREAGHGYFSLLIHALTRSLALVALGVLLSSKKGETVWVFTNVLAQIGLGYLFLFILWWLGWETQVALSIVILAGYFAWFATFAPQGSPLDYAKTPVEEAGALAGFFNHWSAHTSAAADFDRWFLNLFPRSEKHSFQGGGYQTLNFIPALVTMTFGLLTGGFLRREGDHRRKCGRLIVAGIVLLLLGTVTGLLACPCVKRIWTPSWTLFSGGWVLLMLAAFYWLVEIAGWRRLVFPLVIVGMNSIFIYLMHSLCGGWIRETLRIHLGAGVFSGAYGPIVERCSVLLVLWLLCLWLYRQKAFLRL